MNYKLAKQLKEAGFPQEEGIGGWIEKDESINVFRSFEPSVKYPTLEEVIEELGEHFKSLEFRTNGEEDCYLATSTIDTGHYSTAKTPLEAVSNLYIKLKE